MQESEIKTLLLEEVQNKKTFDANYDTTCDGCSNDILEGDSFIFLGNKQKICVDCQNTVEEFLEEE